MMEMDGQNRSFEVRALELHSQYAWDYNWIIKTMDFMKNLDFNTLVLHRNDFIDLIIYPGKYFGYEENAGDTIFETYSHIFRKLYRYTPTRRSGPYQRRAFLKRVLEQAKRRGLDVYIENKELYFPDILLEFYPNLVHDGPLLAGIPPGEIPGLFPGISRGGGNHHRPGHRREPRFHQIQPLPV